MGQNNCPGQLLLLCNHGAYIAIYMYQTKLKPFSNIVSHKARLLHWKKESGDMPIPDLYGCKNPATLADRKELCVYFTSWNSLRFLFMQSNKTSVLITFKFHFLQIENE